MNQNFGAINTLFLLFSSWFVVLSVIDIREHSGKFAAKLFTAAVACGLAFSVVKVLEYSEKLSAGIGIITNDFFMYYHILTGLHFVHVLIDMIVLAYLWSLARVSGEHDMKIIGSGAIFWHLVDLL